MKEHNWTKTSLLTERYDHENLNLQLQDSAVSKNMWAIT